MYIFGILKPAGDDYQENVNIPATRRCRLVKYKFTSPQTQLTMSTASMQVLSYTTPQKICCGRADTPLPAGRAGRLHRGAAGRHRADGAQPVVVPQAGGRRRGGAQRPAPPARAQPRVLPQPGAPAGGAAGAHGARPRRLLRPHRPRAARCACAAPTPAADSCFRPPDAAGQAEACVPTDDMRSDTF